MKNIVMACAASAMLAACATPYAPTPYDRELAGVEKIIIIDDAFPDKATTRKLATNGQNMGSAASSAGLAGLLVALVEFGTPIIAALKPALKPGSASAF